MFQLLTFFFLSSSKLECTAPVNFTEPPPNKTLSLVQILFRHGQRTPTHVYSVSNVTQTWYCDGSNFTVHRQKAGPSFQFRFYQETPDTVFDFPLNCDSGELVAEGIDQHVSLGESLRNYYINKLRFIPEKFDPSLFTFTSSPSLRAIRSLQSLITGIYPPLSDNEVIDIEIGADSFSPLKGNPKCDLLENITFDFKNSALYNKTFDDLIANYGNVFTKMNVKLIASDLDDACGWLIAESCNPGTTLPSFINDSIIDECVKIKGFGQFGLYNFSKNKAAFSSVLWRYILDVTDQAIVYGNKKFILYSAHDTTVASALVGLQYVRDKPPPYASQLIMEIWTDDDTFEPYVRFIFNGELITPLDFDEPLVKFDKFRERFHSEIQFCLHIL